MSCLSITGSLWIPPSAGEAAEDCTQLKKTITTARGKRALRNAGTETPCNSVERSAKVLLGSGNVGELQRKLYPPSGVFFAAPCHNLAPLTAGSAFLTPAGATEHQSRMQNRQSMASKRRCF